MQMLSQRTRKSVRMHKRARTRTNTYTHTHAHTHSLHKAHEIWIESKGEHQQIDTAGAAQQQQQPNNDSDDDDDAFGVPVCFCTGVCICMQTCKCVATPWCSGSEKPIHTQNVCCCCCACLPACENFENCKINARDTRHSQKIQQQQQHQHQHHTTNAWKKQRTQRNENINGELASANNYNRNKQM